MNKKHSYEYVKKYFEDCSCILLNDNYVNAFEILNYVCRCGNTSKITFNNFQRGHRCRKCGVKKVIDKTRCSFEYVKKYFEDHNCTLLSDKYVNNFSHLDYICDCGNKSKITFNEFASGRRCKKCGIEKRSGEKSSLWNHNLTDEERLIKRNYQEYNEWRKNVYKRDRWTCDKCGSKKKINAHHLEGYSDNKDLRLSVDNGITLCRKCHLEFHSVYGMKNNTKEQYSYFIKIGVIL